MQQRAQRTYPFSAIVGQEMMKKALLLNAVNTKIGGVLLRGQKGTAKSMAVRALAQLLPSVAVVQGCPFRCDPEQQDYLCDACREKAENGVELAAASRPVPVVELPIGATEDRVVGTLDIEKAIKLGEKHFEPGLLAAANRGILYIDEVNLLDDHLVDVLLDAAAMGMNFIEREGISFSHPASFILVGTMNPEEGDLRPQLLDRFGLAVEVAGILDREARTEVVRRRIAFEADPVGFIETWEPEQERLRRQVGEAKRLLPEVTLGEDMLELISSICIDFAVDGHRADIVIHKTASTLAAYYGRRAVNEDDVREAAELALLHRQRRQPFEEPEMNRQQLDNSVKQWRQDRQDQSEEQQEEPEEPPPAEPPSSDDNPDPPDGGDEPQHEQVFEAAPPYRVKPLTTSVLDETARSGSGRRSRSITDAKSGRYVDSVIPRGKTTDLALDATLRAAAPYQNGRRRENPGGNVLLIERQDLRQKVREKKVGNLILFVVDASGSMAAEERMVATKGALLSLLLDAYQRRDRVGLVTFRGKDADLALPLTSSVSLAERHLRQLPTGGRTPLAHGLRLGLDTLKGCLAQDKHALPLLVLVSDGRANVALDGGNPVEAARDMARRIRAAGIRAIAVDTERDFLTFGLVKQIADDMAATYLRLEELRSGSIVAAVKNNLDHYGERR